MHDFRGVSEFDRQSEELLVEFDQARRENKPLDIELAMANISAEHQPRILSEMACIDLEHAFEQGQEQDVSPFLARYPILFQCAAMRAEVAREHYRLCRVHGRTNSKLEISKRYDVDSSQWNELPIGESERPTTTADTPFPRVGTDFCGYPLVAELGRGALARAYIAKQPDLAERWVVLKVTKRLTAEAEQLARLQHSGIIPVYSIHHHHGLYAICMPYLGAITLGHLLADGRLFSHAERPGEELLSTIVSNRVSTIVSTTHDSFGLDVRRDQRPQQDACSLPIDNDPSHAFERLLGLSELAASLQEHYLEQDWLQAKVALFRQLVDAVAYAHQRGVVHRDLKPENILIANDGRPIVLDFNLAASDTSQDSRLVGGTLPYMSPQQLRSIDSGGEYSPADDVYALGVIFYQLLTGRLPFSDNQISENQNETTGIRELAISRETLPPSCRSLVRSIPASLNAIVMKCLEPQTAGRYHSAGELLEDLNRFGAHQALKHAPDRSPLEHVQKWVRRHPVLTSTSSIVGVSLLLLAGLFGSWLTLRTRATRLEAESQANHLQNSLPETLAALRSPGGEPELLQAGLNSALAILDAWGVEDRGFAPNSPFQDLDTRSQPSVRHQIGDLLYSMAGAKAHLGLVDDISRVACLEQAKGWNSLAERIAPDLAEAVHVREQKIEDVLNPEQDLSSATMTSATMTSATSDYLPNSDNLFTQMLIARETDNRQLWLRLADQLVSQHPADPTHWFTLASARWSAGDYTSARDAFDVSAKLQRNSAVAVFWRGTSSLLAGDETRALEDFSLCLSMRTDWLAPRYNRALANRAGGAYALALEDLDWIVEAGQAGPRVFSLRAQLHQALGDKQQAAADRAQALVAVPRNADDWVSRGVLKIATQPADALADFARALRISPTHVAARQNTAHVESEVLGDTTAAIGTLTELIDSGLGGTSAVASRGILYARQGACDEAVRDAQMVARSHPTALEMLQIAGIYAMNSSAAETQATALSWLAKALAAEPHYRSLAAADNDLARLRDLPAFGRLVNPSGVHDN